MPRYYFDVVGSRGLHRDEFGTDLRDVEEACEQCRGLLPDLLIEDLPSSDLHVITCEVRQEDGRVVYRGRLTYEGSEEPKQIICEGLHTLR